MSAELPSETSHKQGEGPAAVVSEPRGRARRGTWGFILAVIGILVVAGSTAAFLSLSPEPDARNEPSGPATGLACPHLRQAANAYEQDDRAAFKREITRAAEVAEGTLQRSGQAFGEPERIALELDLTGGGSGSARAERLLRLALQGCRALESA